MANDWLEIAQRMVASLAPMKIGDLSSIVRGGRGDVEREGDKVRILADMCQCNNSGQDVFVETSASGRSRLGAGRCGEDKGKSVLKFFTSKRCRTGAPQLSTPCRRKKKVVTNLFIRRQVSAKAEKRRGPAVC